MDTFTIRFFESKSVYVEFEGVFASTRDGKITVWGEKSVSWLLDGANNAAVVEIIDGGQFRRHKVNGVFVAAPSWEDWFGYSVKNWLNWIVIEGATERLLAALTEELSFVRFIHMLNRGPDGKPYWVTNVADMDRDAGPFLVSAFLVSNHLTLGSLDGLKNCQRKECQKFFVGRSNAFYCSKNCGSIVRVKKKRKKDKIKKFDF